MKNIFIVNPTSGKGKGLGLVPTIQKYFKDAGGEYEIILTEYPKHATEIVSKYTKDDDVVVYSVGGDGTMTEVMNGLNDGVTLCVIPGGTGNDFYRSVDNRKLTDYELIKQCVEGEVVDVDYGLLNGQTKFLNICSFGLDADINIYACDHVKVETKVPNSLVYPYAVLKVGLKPQSFVMHLEVDGVKYDQDIVLLAITNGKRYGGGFTPAPKAEITDGIIDVVAISKPKSLLRLIDCLLKYMKGTHENEPECTTIRGKHFKFSFEREVNYQIDGENYSLTEGYIDIVEGGIKLLMPKAREV